MDRKGLISLCCLILLLMGCNLGSPAAPIPTAPTTPLPATATEPANPPALPTQPVTPTPVDHPASATPLPPWTATSPPFTDTPTNAPLPSGPAIERLAPGQEVGLTIIRMLDATSGWGLGGLAGAGDHVLKTADGGASWADLTPLEPLEPGGKIAAGFFQSSELAWVVYGASDQPLSAPPVVWRTQDGGQTWQASQALDTSNLNEFFYISHLVFADRQTGWLLAHVGVGMNHDYLALYRTNDGGLTWQRLIDPYGDSGIHICQKTGLLFTDPQNGWLTGSCAGVAPGIFLFHTTDGGASWEALDLPPPPDIPNPYDPNLPIGCGSESPSFSDAQTGKIAVQCRRYDVDPLRTDWFLYSTPDGGASWSVAPYPGGALVFLSSDTGWALSKDIYQTRDGGKTWKKLDTVTWEGKFDFVSDQLGWAVATSGEERALVQTVNGGKSWAIIEALIR